MKNQINPKIKFISVHHLSNCSTKDVKMKQNQQLFLQLLTQLPKRKKKLKSSQVQDQQQTIKKEKKTKFYNLKRFLKR